jgi:DNA-binding transcriptional MerR regulator
MLNKAPDAFRTISEVADDLDLPQHVLRFWETRFTQIKPMKRGGGRRYYRPDDVDLLRGIKHLLYEEGYTIRGLQRILKDQGNKFVIGVGRGEIEAGFESGLAAVGRGEFEEHPPPEPVGKSTVGKERDSDAGTGKRAVSVAELTAKSARKQRRDEDRDSVSGPGLTPSERRGLQSTLIELLECKRLLDQMRGN